MLRFVRVSERLAYSNSPRFNLFTASERPTHSKVAPYSCTAVSDLCQQLNRRARKLRRNSCKASGSRFGPGAIGVREEKTKVVCCVGSMQSLQRMSLHPPERWVGRVGALMFSETFDAFGKSGDFACVIKLVCRDEGS